MWPVTQLDGSPDSHENCGPTCVCSVLHDNGTPDSIENIDGFDTSHGDNPNDGTGGAVAVERFSASGIPSHEQWGDQSQWVANGVARGLNRFMLAIWSNSNGDPQRGSGIGHWVLTDGNQVMNPIGGRILDNAYLQACYGAQQNYGVVIDRAIGASPAPQPPSHREEPGMKYLKFKAPDGSSVDHYFYVGQDGVLYIRNRRSTDGAWVSDNIGQDCQPLSQVEAFVDEVGAANVLCYGKTGASFHWYLGTDGKWHGLSD